MYVTRFVQEVCPSTARIPRRPNLMPTLTTIVGILPIALGLGAGAESRKPLGAAVVGGLIFSTLLTLVVVPVVYTLLARFAGDPAKVAARERGASPEAEPAMAHSARPTGAPGA